MRRILPAVLILALAVWGTAACKPGLIPTEGAGKPKVTLERVEVQSYFPWADLPARTTLVLGYVFNIDNPSGTNIKLENFKFTTFFEASPGQYLSVSTPTTYDTMYFPANTLSQYRVVDVLDSTTLNLSLAVANAQKIQELQLKGADVIKNWYTKIGDFAFGIKVGEGMAVFSSEKGDIFVAFEGNFPKK
jgi:hypothetical protein